MKAAVRAAHAEIKAESICVASGERVEGVNRMVLEIVCAGRATPILVPYGLKPNGSGLLHAGRPAFFVKKKAKLTIDKAECV